MGSYVTSEALGWPVRVRRKGEGEPTMTFLVNMPTDTDLRARVEVMHAEWGIGDMTVLKGFVGKDLVETAEHGEKSHLCKLRLNKNGQRATGTTNVVMRTKQPDRALGAFGCSLSHAQIWRRILEMPEKTPSYVS